MGWIGSYPKSFKTLAKDEVKKLATSEKNIDYKKLSQEVFSHGFSF